MRYRQNRHKALEANEMLKKIREGEYLQKKRLELFKAMPPNGLDLSSSKVKEDIPLIVAGIRSEDSDLQLKATHFLRQMLAKKICPPINEVVQSGVVPRVVEFLSRDAFPELQFEAAWVLTNIASGASMYTNVIVDHGVVPLFIRLLNSSSEDVREHAVWALGNVAGDSPRYHDLVLNSYAMMPLLSQTHSSMSIESSQC